jgi:hypothetical protein
MKPRTPGNLSLTARTATISGGSRTWPLKACPCCKAEFRPKNSTQRFCLPRCRLLYWAAGEIVRAYRAGKAAGLKNIIEGLR